MYQGLLKKFRNSGEFKWVTAGIVFDGDEYEHWIDETGEHFRHVPSDNHADNTIRRVYALATTKEGGSFICDMTWAEIVKRQNESRATRDDAPWKKWTHEMAKKTAIRQLAKMLPMSSDIDVLLRRDEEELLQTKDERPEQAIEPITDTKAALDAFANSEQSQDLQAATE